VSNLFTAVVCIPVALFVGAILARVFPDALPAALNAEWSKVAAEWITGIGTLVLAFVAVFQDKIRGWIAHPKLDVSIESAPPDCMAVPVRIQLDPSNSNATIIVPSIFLRILVTNSGNATAENVEVYASKLQSQRKDKTWDRIKNFPPMNLTWSDIHQGIGDLYFPRIAPGMGKHCDIASILKPTTGYLIKQGLRLARTALTFRLVAQPFHQHQTVGPGMYKLEIFVAAANAPPVRHQLLIFLSGSWYDDETKMLTEGVHITVD
jgi:hypothetical protein